MQAFYAMKDSTQFRYRHRLETCAPAGSENVTALQTAAFVAYEAFKNLLNQRKGENEISKSLKSMLATTSVHMQVFSGKTLTDSKDHIEAAICARSGLVVIPDEPKEQRTFEI